MIHKRSTALEPSVKIFYYRALTGLTVTNLTLSSDVDQDQDLPDPCWAIFQYPWILENQLKDGG